MTTELHNSTPLRRLAYCWDHLRVPLNAEERHHRPGDVPYWGANSIQGHVDTPLVSEEVVLVGEDGAPFFDRDRPVAFRVAEPIWPNNHIHVLKPQERVDARWLAYALNDVDYSMYVIGSTRDKLTQSALMSILLPTPGVDKQRAIAEFLDRETARIDALIEEQQRLIELLQIRRVAVVDSVLSKGLDWDNKCIETFTPWLPSLPEGWEAVHVKRVLSFGPSNGVSPEAASVDGIKSLSLGAIRAGRVSARPEVTKLVDRSNIANIDDYLLNPGDILLVRGNGNVDLVARAGLVGDEFATEKYIYPDLLIRIRVNSTMSPEFFVWACNATATRAQVRAQARTAVGTFKVAGGMVQSLVLPLPPIDEQHRIVRFLDAQTAKVDTLIAEAERFIDLSRERRAALITAAVTGQIDVRGEVA